LTDDFGNAQAGGIGRRQADAGLEAGNRLQKAHDFVGAQGDGHAESREGSNLDTASERGLWAR
jgi:hypothetical protein